MIRDADATAQLVAAKRLLGSPSSPLAERTVLRWLDSADQLRRIKPCNWPAAIPSCRRNCQGFCRARIRKFRWRLSRLCETRTGHGNDHLSEVADLLSSGHRAVSLAAARTLAALDPVQARRALTKGLTHQSSNVRLYSAAALAVLP